MATIKTILKKLSGEQLIEACSIVRKEEHPIMSHIRDVTGADNNDGLEGVVLHDCWEDIRSGNDKVLVEKFTISYKLWCTKRKDDMKAGKPVPDLEFMATCALADVVSFLVYVWELDWQEAHSTPSHIDDRAPALVVPDAHYATQEEIIDMVNNGHLKVQTKN